MSKSAAIELAVYNIRVNSVHPGIIRTPMTTTESIDPDLIEQMAGRRVSDASQHLHNNEKAIFHAISAGWS